HFRQGSNSSKELIDFNFFRDTRRGIILPLKNLENPLKETLSTFIESNVAKEVSTRVEEDEIARFRGILASHDVDDRTFNKISETNPKDYFKPSFGGVTLQIIDSQEIYDLVTIQPPQAITDSWDTTTILHLSYQTSSFPVFLNSRHREIMRYRYEQYKAGLEVFKKNVSHIIPPTNHKACFGEVTFSVANNLFTSDLISSKTPKQIVQYRNAMHDTRRQFLSKNLMEIASIAQENPWDAQTKQEIEKFIMGKLISDLLEYNDKSCEIWEKMFGNIAIHLAEISKTAILGGSAGGLLGDLIPNTSAWHMLLIGALAGAATEAPNLVKSITETILESRKAKRSSIAYIAKFKL
ncbi:MAG TPA: hypothetical protein VEP90_29415, partial [Methylomirabilota bacterium]|nr:hypothetical protein [Methylomirabilota bacterium]